MDTMVLKWKKLSSVKTDSYPNVIDVRQLKCMKDKVKSGFIRHF